MADRAVGFARLGVVGGGGFGGDHSRPHPESEVNGMSSALEANWNSGQNSTRQTYKTMGWAAYGAGAACVVGGALLYYLGWRRGEHWDIHRSELALTWPPALLVGTSSAPPLLLSTLVHIVRRGPRAGMFPRPGFDQSEVLDPRLPDRACVGEWRVFG